VRDLSDAAVRQIKSNVEPSADDKAEIEALYVRTLERMEKATLLLMSRDPKQAQEFIREKEQINIRVRLSRKARLEKPLPAQTASKNILDMIGCLRQVNSELTSLGYAIVRDRNQSATPNSLIALPEEESGPSSNLGTGAAQAACQQKDFAQRGD
jgi:Na+/phosphate symporter